MKSILHEQFKQYNLLKKKSSTISYINTEEAKFKDVVIRDSKVNNARLYYCASKINALVRGYLDRLFCIKLLRKLRASKVIQRLIRGKLGRIRWQREYWKSLSVVQSPEALQEILLRSKVVRERYFHEQLVKYHWFEYYDPLTESFWYYNRLNKRNTWEVPYCFQTDLICNWNGFDSFGSIHSKPCRAIFATRQEYYNHLTTAHRWYCVACFTCNAGIQFPTCSLCSNTFDGNGVSGEQALKDNVTNITNKLKTFLRKDLKKTTYVDQYKLRTRLIDVATFYREHLEQPVDIVGDGEDGRPSTGQLRQHHRDVSQLRRSFDNQQNMKNVIAGAFAIHAHTTTPPPQPSGKAAAAASSATKLPPIPGASSKPHSRPSSRQNPATPGQQTLKPNTSTTTTGSSSNKLRTSRMEDTISPLDTAFVRCGEPRVNNGTTITASEVHDALSTGDMYDMQKKGYLTATTAHMVNTWKELGGYEGEQTRDKDDIARGVLSDEYFHIATSIHNDDIQSRMLNAMFFGVDDDEHAAGSDSDDDSLNISAHKKKQQHHEKGIKLAVCPGFVHGTCGVAACPLAHPGIRDNAQIFVKHMRNEDGSKKQVPYVFVCPDSDGASLLAAPATPATPATPAAQAGEDVPDDLSESSALHVCGKVCPRGRKCTHYHVYFRPSTTELIRALYPIRCGQRQKNFRNGAKLVGNVRNDQFDGYGTMVWDHGAVYMGDWHANVRHGVGVYRTRDGHEYVGQYQHGLRHGWGLWTSPNGDEYLGEWHDGKMEGVGMLTNRNGDTYRGEFRNNLYHGIGWFTRANGDVYMGHCHDGKAQGLGVLALSSGEKYKGYFERNARHGQGACVYANGARYAGQWYRGVHQGVGIFLSAQGEKYIGEWAGGRKHGTGRYFFLNGDFYDGEFCKHQAHGKGVYYHANGNVYTGLWQHDMRNGRGTYVFANGSKYTGNWLDNKIHIKGKFDFANGAFYRGEFNFNTKHGRGIYTWPNGNVYKGDFFQERLCGKGELKYIMGHRYVGMWRDNKKHGFGVMYYANGSVYEGNWTNDVRQGKGKLTLIPGTPVEESYDGDWDQDQWHGQGTYRYRKMEGTVYEGDWEYGVRHGQGTLTYKDGSFYRGEFRKDQMWGKGIFVDMAEGSQYDGEWRANMRQGAGTTIDSDGNIYQGEFFGNMKQGQGKVTRPDATVYHGTWEAGIIIGTGKVTIPVGDKKKRDGLPKEITLKVFGY